mgnify:CR=1 FL=1
MWGLRQDQINLEQLDKMQVMVKVGQALSETERIGLDNFHFVQRHILTLVPAQASPALSGRTCHAQTNR